LAYIGLIQIFQKPKKAESAMKQKQQTGNKVHWRGAPPQPMLDLGTHQRSYNNTALYQSQQLPLQLKISDVKPRKDQPFGYFSPISDARQQPKMWRNFQVNPYTSRLPQGRAHGAPLQSPIVGQSDANLPLQEPHAIAVGLALLLIVLGLLSFVL